MTSMSPPGLKTTMYGVDVTSIAETSTTAVRTNPNRCKSIPFSANLTANRHDFVDELSAGGGQIARVQPKEPLPGEFRRLQFGEGCVPFVDAFQARDEIGYTRNHVIEMRNDGKKDARSMIDNASFWKLGWMPETGLLTSCVGLLNA